MSTLNNFPPAGIAKFLGRSRRRLGRVALLSFGMMMLALTFPNHLRAQGGIGDIVYTVGTSTRDTFGRDWAYILWQATEPGLISNRVFAIYAKPGDATNSALFVRKSVVMLQTDARVIEPLLRRAENLGDDQNKLQDDLQQLFANLMPSNIINRAERLSAVIRGSLSDASHYQNLLLLARNHAGINLALGFADAELIGPGMTTFEVRAYDMAANKDLAVIGRVTVEANNPTILPQPGAPVRVPELSAMGDLNIKLRWGTPDELRRLGLMQFGYNLYRVERGYAVAHGWNAGVRPPLATLLSLTTNNPAVAKRVNRVPIAPSKLFTLAEAANFIPGTGDSNTMFIMDDDGRGRVGYINYGWTNGAQFFYYAAGRDVLGRDGVLSFGLMATVCDVLPPVPPRTVHVANDYTYNPTTMTSNQWLRITWKQSPNTNDTVTNYWIYRWSSITQMHNLSGGFSNHLIAVVPHVPGNTYNSYLDNGPQAPNVTNDTGKTYWYTVRAGDAGACGQNLSGPGGPAYGVLRDRIGPAGGGGFIQINCLRPIVRYLGDGLVQSNGLDSTLFAYKLDCKRLDARFEWAEFYALIHYANAASNYIVTNYYGRLYYLNDDTVSAWWTPPRNPNGQQYSVTVQVLCRAGMFGGKISGFIPASVSKLPDPKNYDLVRFEASADVSRVIAGDRRDQDCFEHDSGGTGGAGGTNDIGVYVIPTPGSKEYRIYRRVDDGPLSLICEGAITNIASIIQCLENAPPVNGGTICFFVQLLDEHGNPSPMTQLGCVDTAPVAPLPVPVLAKITSTGDENSPGVNISWFCPPYGVERFELRIAGLPVPPDTNGYNLSPQLAFTGEPGSSMTFSNFGTNLTLSFFPYITPKAGPGFGNNGAMFIVPGNVELGKTYIMTVRALGKNGNASGFSTFETFVWNPTNAPNPNVPWPARGVPATNASFAALGYFLSPTNANALLQTASHYGNAILIGFDLISGRSVNTKQGTPTVGGIYNPNNIIATNTSGQRFFPITVYRYQVPNANYPVVSGDVIQVSPLMEVISYQVQGSGGTTNTIIHDPFIEATSFTITDTVKILYLWLRDTQPQISGATYRYVVMRFKENQEIDQLILSNEVDVP